MIRKPLLTKQIVLAVTGSIAAYKACELLRLLQDAGAKVKVIMTTTAAEFVTPMTFQALSQQPVHISMLQDESKTAMDHIELARWADAVIIAPASADCIARLAQGRADDLLGAVCLATSAPIAVAPAMNQQMWNDDATQENIEILLEREIALFGPEEGTQACGDEGLGRLLEPIMLLEKTFELFQTELLQGLTVLVTAGPTREAIDPVRYISNRSSGKMGFALAEAIVEAGGHCLLVSGPVNLETPNKVERIDVISSEEMHHAVLEHLENVDIMISAAAVCDYRPEHVSESKIKKSEEGLQLTLVRNPDILTDAAEQFPDVYRVGFAAETEDLEANALEKKQRKSLNMIVANDVSQDETGFDSDENELLVIYREGQFKLPRARKVQLAHHIITLIADDFFTDLT